METIQMPTKGARCDGHACYSHNQEAEAGVLPWVWGQPALHSEFKINLNCVVRLCLKKIQKKVVETLSKVLEPLQRWGGHCPQGIKAVLIEPWASFSDKVRVKTRHYNKRESLTLSLSGILFHHLTSPHIHAHHYNAMYHITHHQFWHHTLWTFSFWNGANFFLYKLPSFRNLIIVMKHTSAECFTFMGTAYLNLGCIYRR